MATMTVKDVPEKLHRRLKARAAAHRRSLNSEVIACLEATAGAQKLEHGIARLHAGGKGVLRSGGSWRNILRTSQTTSRRFGGASF